MNHKYESIYFRTTDKTQAQGPQARCHEWSDTNSHEFFVAVDGPFKNEYSSYKDSTTFLKAYDSVPKEERCFFEQIREGRTCKEYYDIDWTLASSADECEIKRLEQQVFAAFLRVRNQHAPEFALDDEHCRVLSASNSEKVSLHIVIPTYVFENNNEHMKAFVLAFHDTWRSASDEDSALRKHIDTKVYTKNRIMRILGSCKFKDTGRPLQRAQWHTPSMVAEDEEFLITAIGPDSIKITSDLQEVAVERAPSTVTRKTREAIQSSLPKYIVDAVRAKFEQTPYAAQFFEMQCYADRPMDFELRRRVQGPCAVCEREHGRENAYLRLAESGAIYLKCYRSTSPAGVEVCKRDLALAVDIEVAMALQTPHGLTHADILDDARFLTWHHLAPSPEHLQLGQGKLEIRGHQPPSLLIRCDTGGGKTVYAEALVKANKKSRFVAITCRRTLADTLDERLCFENYQDFPPSLIACNRLVVQAESLYKLNLEFYCEDTILILDEVSSLIKQMCSDKTHGNMHNLNLQVFERLIQRATRVICLDADLSDEEVEIMKSLRSDFIVINNTFQRQKDDKVVLFDDKMKLLAVTKDLLRDGKRVCISSTMSAKVTETLHAILTEAGFKGVCVTMNTPESVKKDISKNINTTMADLDYFIHTPTISVGVDYNVKDHVDYVVGIFSTYSEVDVETCMQMMRRVRHVKSKTYLVHVDAITKDLPATALEVKKWICNQLDIITGRVRMSLTLKLTLDDNNRLVMPDDLYHRMYCHVRAKKNLSLNDFRSRLIQRMAQAGCIVTGKSDKLPLDSPIIADLKAKEEEITAALHQQTADADPLSPDKFEELSRGTQELDAGQRASMHKFALMRTYDVQDHSIVTAAWVGMFDNAHEKECFKNLSALSRKGGASLKSCLASVRQCEDLGLDYSLRGAPTTAEAHRKVDSAQFVKLDYVVGILTTCRFEDTFATNEVLAEDLNNRIDEIWGWAGLERNMSQIRTTLKMRRPRSSNWTFKTKLAFINTVLYTLLGAKISGTNNRRSRYHLTHKSNVGSAENSPLRR
ncbi:MAG: origin of replication binding protein-domain-containing protein [Linnemannia elongata]|nr:MAG: origin of replication binding protein-domain-containing protein [Linnemannia elongata]